jgi:hypothetical protein
LEHPINNPDVSEVDLASLIKLFSAHKFKLLIPSLIAAVTVPLVFSFRFQAPPHSSNLFVTEESMIIDYENEFNFYNLIKPKGKTVAMKAADLMSVFQIDSELISTDEVKSGHHKLLVLNFNKKKKW